MDGDFQSRKERREHVSVDSWLSLPFVERLAVVMWSVRFLAVASDKR
jgi:hypothetical protein